VPTDGPPVKIFVGNGSIETSFPLKQAKVIRGGNLHLGIGDFAAVPLKQQPVADTSYVNGMADVATGTGTIAELGNRVTIRYTLYADTNFATELMGIKKNRTLEFTLGGREVGAGMETAVQGMKMGGKRRVSIREEVAPRISKVLGGVQPHTLLAIEIDLVKVE
jgi:peptidylprolyl isomerase